MNLDEREQAFLDEVYRKARLLEYDKREAEKVLRNRRMLARQHRMKLALILGSAASVAGAGLYGQVDQALCVVLSLLLIGAGIAVEKAELTWNPDKSSGSGSN
ncbi:hypothetical protein [Paenibacillus tengchongensis]|uniref:hypothetical protein n=1 Tax=Paenibacillus tengchongensis TaxID=2608684 RepID=UPI00124C9201|nr:hypothetical protein [Paenibacillus tengchongensis]